MKMASEHPILVNRMLPNTIAPTGFKLEDDKPESIDHLMFLKKK
jgi:hypothetical protein